MSLYTDINQMSQAYIELPKSTGTLSEISDENHQRLLDYLQARLKNANTDRATRINRYSRIDRLISTWMKLTQEDSERELVEDNTGKQQAIAMNIPLLVTHLEDMVSFFAEVYAPSGRDFYIAPNKIEAESARVLADRMNRDTRARKYYKELCSTIRSLLKYNIGGFAVRWEAGKGLAELAEPGNRIESLDMYNFLFDPAILDISKLSTEGEFSARITVKSYMWLMRKALRNELQRVDKVVSINDRAKDGQTNSLVNRFKKTASFYRNAPTHVGLSIDGADQKTSPQMGSGSGVDWASYGATLEGEGKPEIQGFEVIEMYCWLNPKDFGLVPKRGEVPGLEAADAKGNGYSLWRFTMIDNCQVCAADHIQGSLNQPAEIPHYVAYMMQDDMKEAQRSIMELMKGFQRFGSFLMNIFVAGARKNIWGLKAVDPGMFDTSGIDKGEVVGVLKSKIQGRDVRTGLMDLTSKTGVDEAFDMLTRTLELVRVFFPSQAQPAQIAGMDRAIKSQVQAVLQGTNRRLHMLCRLLDDDLMHPTRVGCYRNLAVNDAEGLSGLTEEIVSKVLGSGLAQINAEALAQSLQELIFALLQNPESMQAFDMPGLMDYWSRLKNSPTSLGDFVRQIVQGPAGAPAPGAEGTPGAAGPELVAAE